MTEIESDFREFRSNMEFRISRIEKHIDKHQEILFNDGKGLMWKLKSLEQSKRNNRGLFPTVINIILAAAAIGSMVIMLLK